MSDDMKPRCPTCREKLKQLEIVAPPPDSFLIPDWHGLTCDNGHIWTLVDRLKRARETAKPARRSQFARLLRKKA